MMNSTMSSNNNNTDHNNNNNTILFQKDEDMDDVDEQVISTTTTTAATATHTANSLPTRILPSPYSQHQPADSRYQNALQRIQADPQHDIEAWEAILTEVQVNYRQIMNVHAPDAETAAQLEWMMSCYGHLLQYFPYAVEPLLAVATLLYRCSALFGEEGGPVVRVVAGTTQRARQAQATLDRLFQLKLIPEEEHLSVSSEEAAATQEKTTAHQDTPQIPGICSWYVPLWLLYLQNTQRSLARHCPPEEQRPRMHQAFQMALKYAGGHSNNHELWKKYIQWIQTSSSSNQMVELRSAYQQLITHPMTGLDGLWQDYEAFEKAQNEVLAQALIQEWAPKYQHARSVYLERSRVYAYDSLRLTRLAAPPDADARQEECDLWGIWKTALAYERTNPERLNATELTIRLRGWWQAAVCVFTRHLEPWHMWSMWESTTASVERQRKVLQLGQQHVPDSVLLAIAESQLVELQSPSLENSHEECIQVMERNIQRAPSTLGFVVLQQLVRRYRGTEAARQVFARGRRVLGAQGANNDSTAHSNNANKTTDGAIESNTSSKIVTNRWSVAETSDASTMTGTHLIAPRPITWHLYAAHAAMEQHQNHAPEIAARVYELGLRKHSAFLQKPAYVLRYASLLLQLDDPVNLRALLTRAVAACSNDTNASITNNPAAHALWDLQMYFEHFLVKSTEDMKRLHQMEAQRRQALFGPDVEDVGTGALHSQNEKASISEQLVRQEGYDTASKIVNGLQRSVDLLSVSGWWGNQDVFGRWNLPEAEEDWSGGASDASFYERQRHQNQRHDGLGFDLKQQTQRGALGAAASTATAAAGPASAMMVAIQTSPEWLRPLLLLLPASRLRLPIVAKPPPHLVEMALATLLNNDLPAERPAEEAPTTNSNNKRTLGQGDDSDDENGMDTNGGGFGGQFRARQRQRVQEHMVM